ncbi:MAG: hypothetical protein ISR45_09165 [Rhodospirillales bacterium]|nr:hypothetical protein [Rhodospirillales bacterium]
MAVIYGLGAYRTHHLMEKICEQACKVSADVKVWREKISSINQSLENCACKLEIFDSRLADHRISCEKLGKRSREIQRVLECDDVEELLKVRRNLRKSLSRT